jgi:undecaprenyl phosphate N,N'-diacetylbacillosamine 1-phosphate transferase
MNYQAVKRIIDMIAALAVLIVCAPLFLVITILIKLDSKGPVLFWQERVGENFHIFKICKFRTMVVGADKMGTGIYSSNHDLRITRVGKILRKTSLDELPQIINVLKGEMSIVGPRPTLEYQTRQYNDYQRQRLNVKPGVTGLAQVNGRQSLTWKEKIDFDVEYVNKISIILDLKIILKTLIVVFKSSDTHKKTNKPEDDQII